MFTLELPRVTVNVKTSDIQDTNLLLQDVDQMLEDIIYFALQFVILF